MNMDLKEMNKEFFYKSLLLSNELDHYESIIGSTRLNWFSLRDDSMGWEFNHANKNYKRVFWESANQAEKMKNSVIPRYFEPYSVNRMVNMKIAGNLMKELYFDFDDYDMKEYHNLTENEYLEYISMNRVLATHSAFFTLIADNYHGGVLSYNMLKGSIRMDELNNIAEEEYRSINTHEEYSLTH